MEKVGTLPKSSSVASIVFLLKIRPTSWQNYGSISLMNVDIKILNKNNYILQIKTTIWYHFTSPRKDIPCWRECKKVQSLWKRVWQSAKASLGEQLSKMWYTHTMKCYTVIKKNEVPIQAAAWINFKNILLSEGRQAQLTTYGMIPFI